MNLPNSITISRIATVPLLIWILSPAFPATHATHGLAGGQQELHRLRRLHPRVHHRRPRRLPRPPPQADHHPRHAAGPAGRQADGHRGLHHPGRLQPAHRPPWIAVIIIGREFLVSGLRSIAASEGFTIEASEIGKLKTVIQIVSVVAAILAHRWDYWNWGGFIVAVHMIAIWAIVWMTIVSIISATDYFVAFWKKIDHAAERARTRRSSVLSRRKPKAAPAEHPSHIS